MNKGTEKTKPKILIADGSDKDRHLFAGMLGEKYDVVEADGAREAISVLESSISQPALVLLDPDLYGGGFAVLERMNDLGLIDTIPVIMISSDSASEVMRRAYELGAVDCVSREVITPAVRKRVENVIDFFTRQKSMLLLLEEKSREAAERSERLAHRDEMTNCLNMEGFRARAEEVLETYPERQYALWFSDIKHFKFINDFFGYEAGNALLCHWAELIKSRMLDDEVLGRISGDRFVTLTRMEEGRDIKKIYAEVLEGVKHFFDDKNGNLKVEIYSGVYVIKPHDPQRGNIDQMLDQARIAQSTIKDKSGGGVEFFDEAQYERVWRNMEISNHLDEALENGEISVWLQPQYNYVTGDLIGAEALCRWHHPDLGSISPGEFIPILEGTGQVYKLDCFVWEKCCELIKKWRDEGASAPVSISVNLSRADLEGGDVVGKIEELIEKYSVKPELLRIEITESAYMKEPEKIISMVKEFQKMGFTVEMDDFGSGYSSLNMLKDVPVDVLKIDFKFLHGADEKSRSPIILSSILKMAHQMEIPVICEGVETVEQADFMKNIGCKLMQGYYFARPMPVTDFERLLSENRIADMPKISAAVGLKKLNELFDASSSSSYIFNRCMGGAALLEYSDDVCEVMLVNDAFYATAGVHRDEEIYAVNLLDCLGPDRDAVKASLEEAVKTGSSNFVCRSNVNGKWFIVSCRHVAYADHGELLFASIEDVTETYEMRENLREVNSELETLIKLVPCGVFRYEAEGEQKFDYVSEGTLKLLGFDSVEAFLKKYDNFPDFVWHEDRERVLGEIDDQIEDSEYDYCTYRIEAADGTLKKVFDKGHIVLGKDGKKYFYVVIVDME